MMLPKKGRERYEAQLRNKIPADNDIDIDDTHYHPDRFLRLQACKL